MLGRLQLVRSTTAFAVTLSTAVLLGGLPRAGAGTLTKTNSNALKKKPACASCAAGPGRAQASPLDGFSSLGRRTQPTPLITVRRSASEGARVNFVGTAAGDLAFAVNDLELRGTMPLVFQRVYSSDRAEDSGLGAGWSFVFDDRITVEGDAADLKTGSGGTVAFRREGGGRRFTRAVAEPSLHQAFELTDADTLTERAAGLRRTYVNVRGTYRLKRIADDYGNSIDIGFDARGNVARVASGDAALTLRWSAGGEARLLSVADSTGRLVSFTQDGRRLRSVTDAAGAHWSYGYAGGRLVRAADPLGRVLLRVSYDGRGRAAEAGDGAGAYLFDYEAGASGLSRRTVVTDPAGARAVFAHNGAGAVKSVDDAEGRLLAVEYNAANLPLRVSDSSGNGTTFDYDAENRLLRQSSGDGSERSYTYDAAGRASAAAARDYRATRDARGRLTSLAPKAGGPSVSFEYDGRGNETAAVYSDGGRFESVYDAAGRRVAWRLPSGLSYAYDYNARGQVVRRRDNRGHSLTLERDASGAVARVYAGDGRWVRAARDEAGRVVALTNSEGKTRRFEYDARGALTDYVDGRGRRLAFKYDGRGRVTRLTDAEGAEVRFGYDRTGRLASVRRVGRAEAPAARFVAAGFEPPAAPVPQSGFGCLFGGDDWFSGDTWGQLFGAGCDDPFGGFGDWGDWGGWGDWNGWDDTNPESCWRCKARQKAVCQLEWDAKYKRALALDGTATVACAVLTAGSLALACAAAAGIAGLIQVSAANDEYEACVLKIPEACSSACN